MLEVILECPLIGLRESFSVAKHETFSDVLDRVEQQHPSMAAMIAGLKTSEHPGHVQIDEIGRAHV